MKITSVYVERSFKIKDYEMRKIGFNAELSEQDKPLEVTRDLEMLIHQHHENMIAAGNGVAGLPSQTSMHVSPSATPTPPKPQTPAAIANENQARREAAATANPLWEQMQSTTKGPWERTRDLNNPATQEIINQLNDHNGFYQDDGFKYWLLTDQEDPTKVRGVGRRAK